MAILISRWHLGPALILALIESVALHRASPAYQQLGRSSTLLSTARFFLLNFVLIFIYRVWIYPRFFSPLRSLPSPKGSWIPLLNFFQQFREPFGSRHREWLSSIPNPGLIRVLVLSGERLLVASPAALRELLVTKSYDFEKDVLMRDIFRCVVGDGLIVAEGDSHRFLRKSVMPVFSFRGIRELYPIFWSKSVRLAKRIGEQVRNDDEGSLDKRPTSIVEMDRWAVKATMDVIGLAALGQDFRALDDGGNEIVADYEELLRPTAEKFLHVMLSSILSGKFIRSLPWKLNDLLITNTERLRANCAKIMEEKRAIAKQGGLEGKDILTQLLQAATCTDKQIVDQLLTFLPAGHETTGASFTWACYLLATHPETQTTLRDEVLANVPCIDTEAVPEDMDLSQLLESLPILNGVCSETIRLYPTPPSGTRTSARPVTLLGYDIPVGTEVIISQWAINRSEEFWGPDAEAFVPQRWIDTDEKTGAQKPNRSGGATSNYAMMSFGQGPRSCIGQGFARAEMRCLVAALVAAFDIKMANPEDIVMPYTVIGTKPKGGLRLRLSALRK